MGFTRKKLLGKIDFSGSIESIKQWCLSTFSKLGHVHTKKEITDFEHTHEIADTTDLQNTLNNKAPKNHTHSNYALVGHTHLLVVAASVAIVVTSNYTANGSLTCTNSGLVIIVGGVGYGTYNITKNGIVVEQGSYNSIKTYSVQVSKGDVIAFANVGQGATTPIGTWGRMVNIGFGDVS